MAESMIWYKTSAFKALSERLLIYRESIPDEANAASVGAKRVKGPEILSLTSCLDFFSSCFKRVRLLLDCTVAVIVEVLLFEDGGVDLTQLVKNATPIDIITRVTHLTKDR